VRYTYDVDYFAIGGYRIVLSRVPEVLITNESEHMNNLGLRDSPWISLNAFPAEKGRDGLLAPHTILEPFCGQPIISSPSKPLVLSASLLQRGSDLNQGLTQSKM